ncbi:hypothetical protein SKAU_G00251780 [Synaphobranchus kaupii]|uniref:Uncharacterized protein n=1 Tax=Synaphobranchus kaupii TaxID=118154 RepID=A0A9Q1IRP2_SYNKA|nr:hypothetical protein SKAU_G00251780 [Synaphobranchus kaupii]
MEGQTLSSEEGQCFWERGVAVRQSLSVRERPGDLALALCGSTRRVVEPICEHNERLFDAERTSGLPGPACRFSKTQQNTLHLRIDDDDETKTATRPQEHWSSGWGHESCPPRGSFIQPLGTPGKRTEPEWPPRTSWVSLQGWKRRSHPTRTARHRPQGCGFRIGTGSSLSLAGRQPGRGEGDGRTRVFRSRRRQCADTAEGGKLKSTRRLGAERGSERSKRRAGEPTFSLG